MADTTDETDLAALSAAATQLWLRSQSPSCAGSERAAFAGQAELLQAKVEQLARARLDSGGPAFVAGGGAARPGGRQAPGRAAGAGTPGRYRERRPLRRLGGRRAAPARRQGDPLRAGVALQRPFEKPRPAKRT